MTRGTSLNYKLLVALNALLMGPKMEPLLHPKPGAVTRLSEHKDKNVVDFCEHTLLIESATIRAFVASKDKVLEDPIAEGLEEYFNLLRKFKVKSNIALGTTLLHVPLAAALGDLGYPADPSKLVQRASSLVLSSERGGKIYYKILELLRPSHLRKYEGPIPAVGEGYPRSFAEVLRSAAWDLVHSELLKGYPLSLKVLSLIDQHLEEKKGIEESALLAMLKILSDHGDTLILTKYGIRAYQKAIADSRIALFFAERVGIKEALRELDREWRKRGWNPGAVLDIVSTGISLYYYSLIIES